MFEKGKVYELNPSQIALRLVLDEMGVAASVETFDDRKRVQKATYLAQAAGVDLGCRFGWYIHGPYSPKLTRQYYAAFDGAVEDEVGQYSLHPALLERLKTIKPALEAPAGASVEGLDWLELVASVHFLMTQRKLPWDETEGVLAEEKSHLAADGSLARDALVGVGLL